MTLLKGPAQYPDIRLTQDPSNPNVWLSRTWSIPIFRDGIAFVVSQSIWHMTVEDDGVEVGTITLNLSDAADGQIGATITDALITQLKRYSTWKLYESPRYNDVLVQGRFVKQ